MCREQSEFMGLKAKAIVKDMKVNNIKFLQREPLRKTIFILGIVFLANSWLYMFFYIAAMTEGYLAPWDIAPHPPIGTWQSSVNGLFEGPGGFMPGALVVVISAAIFFKKMNKGGNVFLPFLFAATNCAFIYVSGFAERFLWWPLIRIQSIGIIDYHNFGYYKTWKPILGITFLILVLLLAQSVISSLHYQTKEHK